MMRLSCGVPKPVITDQFIIIGQDQNNIRAVDQLDLAAAFCPYTTYPFSFYLTRCYSPRRLGRSTLGYFSLSPFFGMVKWLGVRERMAGLNAVNLAVSSFLLQLRTVPYFLSIKESQLSFAFDSSTLSYTHFLNLRCSAYAVQLSLNSKCFQLFQNSSGANLKTFLLFSGMDYWLLQSYLGSFGMKVVVFRYSQRRNLERLLSSKENSRLADLQWLRGSKPTPKAWITHLGWSCNLATTVAPWAQILFIISSGLYRRHAVQLVVSMSCLGRSQTRLFLRGSWLLVANACRSFSALPTRLRQSACSS